MRLDVSVKADQDLASIFDYTSQRWGASQAERYTDQIYAGFEIILQNPEIGVRQKRINNLRKLPAERHMIYYEIEAQMIRIVRVLHESANPKRLVD